MVGASFYLDDLTIPVTGSPLALAPRTVARLDLTRAERRLGLGLTTNSLSNANGGAGYPDPSL